MQLTLDELKLLLKLNRLDYRKKNAYGICPECGHDEFGISLDDNHRFGCFRKKHCGFNGNIYTLLRYLGKKISDVKPGFEPRAKLENKLILSEETDIDLSVPDISMPIGWQRIHYHEYLEGRGFTQVDYEKFQPGVALRDPRFGKLFIIFPILSAGKVKGYIARNLKSKKEIEAINKGRKARGERQMLRYKNSSSDFAKLLLGIEECTENTTTAILVEGLFDKQNVDKQLNLDVQEEVKCLVTFKCGVSDEQIFLIQETGIHTIVLLYDPDVIEEIKRASWKLENYFHVYIGFNEEGSDPGDMSLPDFDRILDNLQTPSQFSQSKLDAPELKKK